MMAHGKAVRTLSMKVAQSGNFPVLNARSVKVYCHGWGGVGRRWVRVSRVKDDSTDRLGDFEFQMGSKYSSQDRRFFFLFTPYSPLLETITQQAHM